MYFLLDFLQARSKAHSGRVTRHYAYPNRNPLGRKKARMTRAHIWDRVMEDHSPNFFLAIVYLVVLFIVTAFPGTLFESPRWSVVLDMNRDGFFTITDLFYWCFWLFYLPGDVVVAALMQFDGAVRFFELFAESYGGLGSLIMSCTYWWVLGGPSVLVVGLIPIIVQTYWRG